MSLKKHSRRAGLIVVEVLAVAFVLCAIAGSYLAWRLLDRPMELDFAKPYIQDALKDEASGITATMDRVVLYWPDIRKPILIGLENAVVFGPEGKELASIGEAALGLNKARLLLGQVVPEALILKEPSLRVIRHRDNSFDIGLLDTQTYGPELPKANGVKDAGDIDIIETVFEYIGDPSADEKPKTPLSMLKSFEVEDAQVVVDDQVLLSTWSFPKANMLIEKKSRGVNAQAYVELPSMDADVLEAPVVEANAMLEWRTKNIEIDATLKRFDVAVLGEKLPDLEILRGIEGMIDANVKTRLSSALDVMSLEATALSNAGEIQIDELAAEPVPFSDLGLRVTYDKDSGFLNVARAQIKLRDVAINANAELRVAENDIKGPIRVEFEPVTQAQLAAVWPVALKDEGATEWVVEKLSKGTFSNAYAQIAFAAKKPDGDEGWLVDAEDINAGFDFTDMDIAYKSTLAPITGANGRGAFNYKNETLSIAVENAKLLDMDVTAADVALTDIIQAGKAVADINIPLKGPLKSVLKYIKDDPIGVQTDAKIEEVQGDASLEINLNFPAVASLKAEEIKLKVNGSVANARVSNLVPNMTLSGGPFAMKIDGNDLSLKGKGQLEGRDVDVDYKAFLNSHGKPYKSKVNAVLRADHEMRQKFGVDLSEFLSGSANLNVIYTEFRDGTSQADVKADITSSRLFIEPFKYEKPPGEKGEVTLTAKLKNNELIEISTLSGSATNLTVEPTRLTFRTVGGQTELSGGNISRFTLNETVGKAEFEVEPSGRIKIAMDGPFLDLRPFLAKDDEPEDPNEEKTALELSVAVDRMRTADGETVQYAKMYADLDKEGRFNQLEVDGIAGKGDIYLRYKPDGTGKRTFRFEADDAGAALKAFEVYDKIQGGRLVIYGEPKRGFLDRNLIGVAELTDFKVVKAPSLARLLGAMSLPGVTQLLNNDGLGFAKLEANFDWNYKPEGSLLVLKDGRTSGNSLGLTFDGTFDNAASQIDVTGTIIPLSGVNKMIGNIPLIGDIITGGTGALIAATYSMKGNAEEPKVFVNPLSVLTPGILRRILFEN